MKILSNNYIIMLHTKDNFYSQHFIVYLWNKNYLKKIKELKFDKTIRFFIEGDKGNIFAFIFEKNIIQHINPLWTFMNKYYIQKLKIID